jgi:hypothetical protein
MQFKRDLAEYPGIAVHLELQNMIDLNLAHGPDLDEKLAYFARHGGSPVIILDFLKNFATREMPKLMFSAHIFAAAQSP